MIFQAHAVRDLAEYAVPIRYDLRSFRPGDEASWARTLNLGGFTDWDSDKVLRYLEEPERREGSSLVAYAGEIVAATFASRVLNRGTFTHALSRDISCEGVVDYVVTRPDHQGHRLGRATAVVVTKFLIDRGCKIVTLSTDEWRLPAIHTYLSIGFQPVMNREDMSIRWEAVLNKLKEDGRAYP